METFVPTILVTLLLAASSQKSLYVPNPLTNAYKLYVIPLKDVLTFP
jgi:hypothetical protein